MTTLSTPAVAKQARRTAGVRSSGSRDPVLVGLVALVVYGLHGYDGVLDRDLWWD